MNIPFLSGLIFRPPPFVLVGVPTDGHNFMNFARRGIQVPTTSKKVRSTMGGFLIRALTGELRIHSNYEGRTTSVELLGAQ